ncbi:MAG TPA: hypothetical protein VFK47_17615 [Ktedonobacteraceae bacterium]|nr:hypothetical protein [Ktedonobacteraceae bacterium]
MRSSYDTGTDILQPDPPDMVLCIVCQATVPVERATVGELDAAGRQAFACARHLSPSERLLWFTAWAQFAVRQSSDNPARDFALERYREHVGP